MTSLKRVLIATVVCICLPVRLNAFADEQKAPGKLVFQAKMGNVTFDHAAHLKRAANNCAACHTKLFEQSAKAPLNFKAAMHKTAETAKTSCGGCHHPAGTAFESPASTAFESKGNCNKCHVKN